VTDFYLHSDTNRYVGSLNWIFIYITNFYVQFDERGWKNHNKITFDHYFLLNFSNLIISPRDHHIDDSPKELSHILIWFPYSLVWSVVYSRIPPMGNKLKLKLKDLFITLRPLRWRPLEVFSPTQSSIQQYSSQNFQRKTNEMMNSTRLISQSVNVYTYVADKNFLSITNMTT